ncbi:trans-resveratrol di-O-methyltransferase-like [Pistacia vera]|uniref:trans-resveratrol di-O-methyltransferase-like n=1 Tax=Pistacia vera TaxID=55513 RepID=UPI001262B358|nr:trans-resveratrol di-O-methyltransferase-like [Pistacia vera]
MDSNNQGHGSSEFFQAQTQIYKHVCHFMDSMALKCAVQLGIPDVIHNHNKPINLSELASALQISQTKTDCLQRLMRLLQHSGFFATTKIVEDQEQEGYILTPFSNLLVKDNVASLSPVVLALLDPVLVNPWHSLANWFQGNDLTPFETAHGMSFWDLATQNLEFSSSMNELMASDSRITSLVIRDHKEIFQGLNSLVDVGGGTGTLARKISQAFPELKCTVLDLPQVVTNLPESENLKFVAGDMFQSIPSADAIVIKSVLHNWSDEDCVKILKRSREAIASKGKGGKLIIIDMVIDDKKEEHDRTKTKLFMDIMMMVMCSGKERKEKDWEKLFLDSGFSHYKITASSELKSIIEVYP